MRKTLLTLTLSIAFTLTSKAGVWEKTCSNCHGVVAPKKEELLRKYSTPDEMLEKAMELSKKGVMPSDLDFESGINELFLKGASAKVESPQNEIEWAKSKFQPLPSLPPIPADNPQTKVKVALGKMLYFDPRLSKSKLISCNTCHNLSIGGDDNQRTSIGHKWQHGPRNAPTVLNAAFLKVQFWDGRAPTLEEQAKGPLTAPVEMAASPEIDIRRVKSIPEYVKLFRAAFPGESDPVTFDNIAKAIAAYERTLITPNSPFDRYLNGDESALTEDQKEGMVLFVKTGCIACHNGPVLSDGNYYKFQWNNDQGRYKVTQNPEDMFKFRTPQLRNVALTAPYFHDGTVDKLEDAIKIMAEKMLNKKLNDAQVWKIKAFLESLTGDVPVEARVLPVLPEEQ